MSSEQLNMFQESREQILEKRLNMLEQQMDRVRKNLFAKYTELMQLYLEQKDFVDSFRTNK